MNRHLKNIVLIVAAAFVISCGNNPQNTIQIPSGDSATAIQKGKIDTASTLDTLINFSDITKSNYAGKQLTASLAIEVLYSHFKKNGYFIYGKLPKTILDADSNKLCVGYDTIYLADINSNNYKDAVILYWLAPPYASGNCWQPHKAIILDTDSGYQITNEEFIPENYYPDSIKSKNGNTVIFGYDYDCGNHAVLKHFKLTLNRQ